MNWAMIFAGWIGDLMEGLIDGAIIHYRSELLITAQKVAAHAAAGSFETNIGADVSPYKEMIRVVAAIIITELTKIIIADLKDSIDTLGQTAIRKHLQNILGERLLAQDLERYDQRQKAQEHSCVHQ